MQRCVIRIVNCWIKKHFLVMFVRYFPLGLELTLGRIANVLEKPRGRSITAAFNLQSAHAESADAFDALLDDAQNAGLSGERGVSRREGHQDQGVSTKCGAGESLSPGEAEAGVLPGDQMVQSHCGNFKTLRRMLTTVDGSWTRTVQAVQKERWR